MIFIIINLIPLHEKFNNIIRCSQDYNSSESGIKCPKHRPICKDWIHNVKWGECQIDKSNDNLEKRIENSKNILKSIQNHSIKSINIKSENIDNCSTDKTGFNHCVKQDINDKDECNKNGYIWLDSGYKKECLKLTNKIKCDTIDKSLDSISEMLNYDIKYKDVISNSETTPKLLSEIFKINPC